MPLPKGCSYRNVKIHAGVNDSYVIARSEATWQSPPKKKKPTPEGSGSANSIIWADKDLFDWYVQSDSLH